MLHCLRGSELFMQEISVLLQTPATPVPSTCRAWYIPSRPFLARQSLGDTLESADVQYLNRKPTAMPVLMPAPLALSHAVVQSME